MNKSNEECKKCKNKTSWWFNWRHKWYGPRKIHCIIERPAGERYCTEDGCIITKSAGKRIIYEEDKCPLSQEGKKL